MNTKHPLASKTIVAALVTMIAGAAPLLGLDLSDIDVEKLVTSIFVIAGAIGAIYGRIKADKPIGSGKGTTGALAALVMAGVLSACAVSKAETPAQRVYALEVEYQNVLRSILIYGRSDIAEPDVVDHIKRLDNVAFDALTAAKVALKNGDNVTLNAALTAAYSALNEIITYLKQKGAFNVTRNSGDHSPPCRAGPAGCRPLSALHVGTG